MYRLLVLSTGELYADASRFGHNSFFFIVYSKYKPYIPTKSHISYKEYYNHLSKIGKEYITPFKGVFCMGDLEYQFVLGF